MSPSQSPIGFIGLGLMGEPMAGNLLRGGADLVIWNRTASKCSSPALAGAVVGRDVGDVFARCAIVILMLIDEAAVDAVLQRGTPMFAQFLRGHTLINMATHSPDYSVALEAAVDAAGGLYIEAPVSGSRKPAEAGELICMLAGRTAGIAAIRHLLAPMCRDAVVCGPIPNALWMKFAVNLYMIIMVTGLAEAVNLAVHRGLDMPQFIRILGLGPMSSSLMRTKLQKLTEHDFTPQAAIHNVLDNVRLIRETARATGAAAPLLDVCHALYGEAHAMGLGDRDMVAVLGAIGSRASSLS